MRTSFHHQPEAQHPNFQLSTSWQADYPIYWQHIPSIRGRTSVAFGAKRTLTKPRYRWGGGDLRKKE
jgi:hypothetical protein